MLCAIVHKFVVENGDNWA